MRAAIVAAMVAAGMLAAATSAAQLRVYMPRSIAVEGDKLTVESICVLSGDETLAAQAADVPMGRAPWPREKIEFTRTAVLSRLAACGIPAREVDISGAQQVAVRRVENVIGADEIVEAAEALLAAEKPAADARGWRLVARPADLAVAGKKGVELTAELDNDSPRGLAKVRVRAMRDGAELGRAEMLFKPVYSVRRLMAKVNIPAGETVTVDNTQVETVASERPEQPDGRLLYGTVAARRLPAGAAITARNVMQANTDVLVKRNQAVTLRIEGELFTLSALGQALEDGRVGQFIRVRNVDSKRIVSARIAPDGTARPVFQEVTP